MNAIEIKNVGKEYLDFSLSRINLTLPSGAIMGLIGENGAGKTTLIKLLLNLTTRRIWGSITILGKDNKKDMTELKEDIGVVLDEIGFPPSLNAEQIGKIMAGTFRHWNNTLYAVYLERLSVPRSRAFKQLSRGMKVKLAIAVALSHNPKLLILDEPTAGLDPLVRSELTDILMEFTRREDHSVLISSHDITHLEKLCDYIAFLHHGRLLLCEEKDRLLEDYGILRCSAEELNDIPAQAVIGKRETPYGIEALLYRPAAPEGIVLGQTSIEELFVSLARKG